MSNHPEKSWRRPLKRPWSKPEILITAFYFPAFVLALIPHYRWLYRVPVNVLHMVLFCISLLTLALTLIRRCIDRAPLGRVLPPLALGLLVLLAGRHVHRWRYAITETYIRNHCCEGHEPQDRILGGIREIKMDGFERTGAFENSSHCILVPCAEEFYYCPDAAIVIERGEGR